MGILSLRATYKVMETHRHAVELGFMYTRVASFYNRDQDSSCWGCGCWRSGRGVRGTAAVHGAPLCCGARSGLGGDRGHLKDAAIWDKLQLGDEIPRVHTKRPEAHPKRTRSAPGKKVKSMSRFGVLSFAAVALASVLMPVSSAHR